ncbi:pinin/SDK/memA/ protein conserved region-domain-containing protein [Kalaharituber pfeilii]|nr:pinin/SDK/memA/ protein conserved region-domain-containing protein [Kalaharituber pfeilii]
MLLSLCSRTIASAVVVPGDSPERLTKRRTSSSTVDRSKRPRIDTDLGTRGEAMLEQERKRGQRLFGALLGTIGKFQQDSQSARARNSANRRREIEEKLQAKLKAQNEELDERKRKESNVLREKMRREQKVFEEKAMHLRHANLRAQANYLKTKARPSLFYLPWKLTVEEEALIQDQLQGVEHQIKQEVTDFEARRQREEEEEEERRAYRDDRHEGQLSPMDLDTHLANENDDHGPEWRRRESRDVENDSEISAVNPSNGKRVSTNVNDDGGREGTNVDNGDLVIEAGEDTVIY